MHCTSQTVIDILGKPESVSTGCAMLKDAIFCCDADHRRELCSRLAVEFRISISRKCLGWSRKIRGTAELIFQIMLVGKGTPFLGRPSNGCEIMYFSPVTSLVHDWFMTGSSQGAVRLYLTKAEDENLLQSLASGRCGWPHGLRLVATRADMQSLLMVCVVPTMCVCSR